MKLLFAALLVANLIVLIAQVVLRDQGDPVAAAMVAEGNLRLLSEREAAGGCYQLGPFADEVAALRQRRALQEQGYAVALIEHEALEPLGYWVYVPPAASLEAAQVTARRLAGRGIADYVFVVGAEKANAISLGLYSEQAEAETRVAQLQALGFSVQMERRFSRQLRPMLQLRLEEGDPPTAGGLRWQPADCQAARD